MNKLFRSNARKKSYQTRFSSVIASFTLLIIVAPTCSHVVNLYKSCCDTDVLKFPISSLLASRTDGGTRADGRDIHRQSSVCFSASSCLIMTLRSLARPCLEGKHHTVSTLCILSSLFLPYLLHFFFLSFRNPVNTVKTLQKVKCHVITLDYMDVKSADLMAISHPIYLYPAV